MIIAKTIPEIYIQAMNKVLLDGTIQEDERGSHIKEVINMMLQINQPIIENYGIKTFAPHPKGIFWKNEKLDQYIYDFTENPDKGDFIYSYGERLLAYVGVNQVDTVKDRLSKFGSTRRAVVSLYDPTIDADREDIPCFNLAQFIIRDNRLSVNAVWRSQDSYGALYPNLCGLAKLLEKIATDLKVNIGEINLHSMSAHIYETDTESAKKIIKKNKKLL